VWWCDLQSGQLSRVCGTEWRRKEREGLGAGRGRAGGNTRSRGVPPRTHRPLRKSRQLPSANLSFNYRGRTPGGAGSGSRLPSRVAPRHRLAADRWRRPGVVGTMVGTRMLQNSRNQGPGDMPRAECGTSGLGGGVSSSGDHRAVGPPAKAVLPHRANDPLPLVAGLARKTKVLTTSATGR